MDPRKLPPEEALDLFLSDAREGMSDTWLAAQADVSIKQVEQWRKKRGLEPDQTEPSVSALLGLMPSFDPVKHPVDRPEGWDTPRYLLRQALDYTTMARALYQLVLHGLFTEAEAAKAFGFRPEDVAQALGLWRRRLSEKGQQCLGCNALVDPTYGQFCSRRCHDQAVR